MQISNGVKKIIYFDYAATTPLDPSVLKVMLPFLEKDFGNTMSLHTLGQRAKKTLEESREKVASLIKAKPKEIIFTSSATESNNLALKGIAFANSEQDAQYTGRSARYSEQDAQYTGRSARYSEQDAQYTGRSARYKDRGRHIVISKIEHPCIMESAEWLEKQGFEVTRIPVDKYGLINPLDVKKAIRKDTILVSVIHTSNEIGTIQPIKKIGEAIKRKSEILNLKSKIYFHTDAAQSFGKLPIDVNKMNIDLLTASSHKMYGPKGAALLFIREGIGISPLLHGGGQEKGLRASTINLPAIVGFAEACQLCKKEMAKEGQRQIKLRDKLIKGVLRKIKGSHLNGHPRKRLSNNASFWFEFIEGESLVFQLDFFNIAASTGSACSSAKLEPSHILLATGLRPQEAHGSLRISLGRQTREKEINYLLKVLPQIVKNLREISPFKKHG